jgi:hypothetical protein
MTVSTEAAVAAGPAGFLALFLLSDFLCDGEVTGLAELKFNEY